MKPSIYNFLILLGAVAFICLAFLAHTHPYFSWDLQVSRFVQGIDFGWGIQLLNFITNVGFAPQVNVWVGAIALVFLYFQKRLECGVIFLLGFLDWLMFSNITAWVGRLRPSSELIKVSWLINANTFPSGHVLLYTMVFGFLMYLAVTQLTSKILKTLVALFCLSVIFLIGLSRIYFGQHWPSDVLGSYLLGSTTLGVVILVYKWTNNRIQSQSH